MQRIKDLFKGSPPSHPSPRKFDRGKYGGTKVIKGRGAVNEVTTTTDETTPKSVYEDTYYSETWSVSEIDDSDDEATVVSQHMPEDSFVCTGSHAEQQDHIGSRIRERHVSLKASFDNLTEDDVVAKINEKSIKTEELIKHTLLQRIPDAKSIVQLSKLLCCYNTAISCAVISAIKEKIFDIDFNVVTDDLLEVEEMVWHFLETHTGNQDLVMKAGCLNLMLWSSLLSNDKQPDSSTSERICNKTSERLTRSMEFYTKKHLPAVSHGVFSTIFKFMETSNDLLKKKSSLPLSNGESKIGSHYAKEEIENLVRKSTVCELYTFILTQLQIICSKTRRHLHGYEFLLNPSNCLPKYLKRHTRFIVIVLLLNGLVHALTETYRNEVIENDQNVKDPVQVICDLIQTVFEDDYFKSKPLIKHIMEMSLELILPMMYHKSKMVRDLGIQILSNFESIISLPVAYRRLVEEIMSQYCLEIYPFHIDREDDSCPLYQYSGALGSMPVTVSILVSKPQCISIGHVGKCVRGKRHAPFHLLKNNIDVLRSLNSHTNIVELVAFQIKPLPFFSIQEDVSDCSLVIRILQMRESRHWLTEKDKLEYLLDIICGLQYLHSRDIVVRNLTPNSLVIINNRIKLADFSYACSPKEDMSPGKLPTRWLSWETILKGQFSKMSDIYALGLTAYGIWTHGCEPFTEMCGKTTEYILKLVMFHQLQPFQWACTIDSVHSLILRCTKHDPKERVELRILKAEVQELLGSPVSQVPKRQIQEILDEDDIYPDINVLQRKRKHVPEKNLCLEREVKVMWVKKAVCRRLREKSVCLAGHRRSYVNLQFSMWIPSTIPAVKENELSASDCLTIVEEADRLQIYEPVTKDFVKYLLSDLKAEHFKNTGGDMTLEQLSSTEQSSTPTLESRYPFGKTLKDAAMMKWHTIFMRKSSSDVSWYLKIFLMVAETINMYHDNGWLHRDISADTILVTFSSNSRNLFEVFMPRVGRMCKYPLNTTQSGRFVKGETFDNRIRWLPAESVIDGIYSPESDVYMWAVMCWEVFTLLNLRDDNPTRCEQLSVPFCMVDKDEVAVRKQCGEHLERPLSCPDWFYSLLQHCWTTVRTDRPSMINIITRMNERLGAEPTLNVDGFKQNEIYAYMRPRPGRRHNRCRDSQSVGPGISVANDSSNGVGLANISFSTTSGDSRNSDVMGCLSGEQLNCILEENEKGPRACKRVQRYLPVFDTKENQLNSFLKAPRPIEDGLYLTTCNVYSENESDDSIYADILY